MSMHQKEFKPNNNRVTPVPVFFAAYVGPSMNPTLREPEVMEILPYDSRPLRVDDVALFSHRRLIGRWYTALSV